MKKQTMGLDKSQIAWRAAQDLKNGSVVNLGLGTPVLVSNFVESCRDIFFQSENGILGVLVFLTFPKPFCNDFRVFPGMFDLRIC